MPFQFNRSGIAPGLYLHQRRFDKPDRNTLAEKRIERLGGAAPKSSVLATQACLAEFANRPAQVSRDKNLKELRRTDWTEPGVWQTSRQQNCLAGI